MSISISIVLFACKNATQTIRISRETERWLGARIYSILLKIHIFHNNKFILNWFSFWFSLLQVHPKWHLCMQLQQPVQPVSLHVPVAMDNWHRADVRVAHVHDNCTMIGRGADAVMTWNLDTSKYHLRRVWAELKVTHHSSVPSHTYFYCHKYVCN